MREIFTEIDSKKDQLFLHHVQKHKPTCTLQIEIAELSKVAAANPNYPEWQINTNTRIHTFSFATLQHVITWYYFKKKINMYLVNPEFTDILFHSNICKFGKFQSVLSQRNCGIMLWQLIQLLFKTDFSILPGAFIQRMILNFGRQLGEWSIILASSTWRKLPLPEQSM